MSRKSTSHPLFVYMNGDQVGKLLKLSSGNLTFSYDTAWLNLEHARPISLSMPLQESPYQGDLVYHFFDNLLPDNELIRKRIQARFKIQTNQCFDLLSSIGRDCIGALQLLTEPKEINVKKIEAHPLTHQDIANLLKRYQTAPLGMEQNSEFRISIAGAQEKTALLWHKNAWHLPKNTTPTTHIIKLPIGYIPHANMDLSDSVENEWLCLKILSAYELPVNTATMTQFEEIKTLVVERFDRKWMDKRWILRLPQEDMCQVLGKSSGLKYESDGGPGIFSIMQVLQGANHPQQDRSQFMKSVFLFWMLGAIDGHAKNFSVKIDIAGQYRLTPLYDVISAYPLVTKRQLELKELKMAMGLKSKNKHYQWSTIQKSHWLAMAHRCQFPEEAMNHIIEESCDKMDMVIDNVKQQLPENFPASIAEPIFAGMQKIKNRCMG